MSRLSDDIRERLKSNDPLTRLIVINLLVFLFLGVLRIVTFISGEFSPFALFEDFVMRNLAFPLSFQSWIKHPWTLLTYMFTQAGFFHLFWNMLTLFWFGKILSDFTHPKKIIPVYLLGGFAGAITALLFIQFFPPFQSMLGVPLIGASAGVTAIIVAAASLVPNYRIQLLFIGEVRLVYLAIAVIFLDLLDVASYSNVGGNLAHLGGAALGYLFIYFYKKGNDLTKPLVRLLDSLAALFSKNKKLKVVHKRPMTDEAYNQQRVATQQELDAILDKISRSGYESLSKAEKEKLFKASKK